ncbi:Alpha-(1,3)-fucosyltransferase 4 [Holothuria leucospilota]|uniref:Fucosyltransferase n=1 Tax=Holothuria leucospilota TaxID=206669 RepID=A0A9Q0YR77_HOLLE|nr:Alpha-(1,3)-fucosyltransferase 4 [Holothuria leucospilota]
MVQVAFYEGNRFMWIYQSLFKRPEDLRFCKCNFKTNHTIRVKFEKLASILKSYDIVIFPQDKGTKPIKQKTWRNILTNAPPHQRRVYATFEGPYKLVNVKSRKRVSPRGDRFHWSWTFNSRSEFTMPYGYFQRSSNVNSETSTKEANPVNWAKGKTSLVAWMSSWVNTNWKRSQFVEKLSQLIPVHKYGKRYKSCPKGSQSCENKIREYKFYLALENSCCKEYISEKFWRTLDWGIVPIVVGPSKGDYERLAPPNSFIFVDDFTSLKALANYLIEIDKNDTLYNEFFRWRTEGKVHQNYPNYHRKKTHQSPETWFYSCSAVCKVTERYLREREELVEPASGFDPHAEWWGRSCRKCGAQPWFKEFQV